MRYAVACLSLLSAAALAHCAAPDPGEPARAEGPGPAVTPPAPGRAPARAPASEPDEPSTPWLETPRDLVVAIDRATGASRVWVNRKKIPDGARVFLRTRTGQLPTEAAPVLDCAAMAQDTAALAGTPVRERGGDTYAGPRVAQPLLDFSAIFDDPGWHDLAALPALAARTQAGTPIVEACIVGADGATLATYEDVMDRAFDNAARYEAMTNASPTSLAYLPTDIYNSASDYGKLCVSLLGEIPFFDAHEDGFAHLDVDGFHSVVPAGATTTIRPGYATMDLVDHSAEGALIPLTADGAPADCEAQPSDYNCRARCDRPEWLYKGCEAGPKVISMKNAKGTHWVLLARDVTSDTTPLGLPRRLYNDIAMIGHNPKSGKTCFFQNRIRDGVARRGYYIPHPADARDGDGFWRPPASNSSCLSCHSADPFNHSPWIDQAKKANGAHVVPRAMDAAYPDFANVRDNPYTILGAAGFRKRGNNPDLFRIPKQLAPSPDGAKNACLSCHRAAQGTFLSSWVSRSVNGGDLTSKLTDYARDDQHRFWMPLGNGDNPAVTSAAAFTPYQPSFDHLTHCGAFPSPPDCDWVDAPGAQ